MMIQTGSIDELSLDKACITIGSFDGVHLGHKKLIQTLVEIARNEKSPAVVITFHPHPLVVIKGIDKPYYLSNPEEKAEKIAALSVDYLITIPFSKELAAVTADDFIELIITNLGMRHLVVGKGFTLGKNRQGTVKYLKNLGLKQDYLVKEIDPENLGNTVISSSKIRQFIEAGDVSAAAQLLGDDYSLRGVVVRGDARGRTIGFPTANLQVWPEKLLPAPGVYRCFTTIEGSPRLSVANIGYRPTFTNDSITVFVEVHILDFKDNLYGQELQVQFTHRLRGETKFASLDDLVQQINRDIIAAREL